MNSKVQKGALITIIVLLVLFIPMSAGAIYFKFIDVPEVVVVENTNKDLYFDNKLWFYDASGSLLGTYECETTNCGIASNFQSDSDYAIESYTPEEETALPIVNSRFVFLKDFANPDTSEAFLYDILNNTSYKAVTYASVKNYGIGIHDNTFIIENSLHKFNVARLSSYMEPIFEYEYDFIGLLDNINTNGELFADYFVTLRDGNWNIMDNSGAVLTEDFEEEIADFNGTYVLTRDASQNYHIKNYQSEDLLGLDFKYLSFTDRYLNCTTLTDEFYIYDIYRGRNVGDTIYLEPNDVVRSEMNADNNIDVYINDQFETTIILT